MHALVTEIEALGFFANFGLDESFGQYQFRIKR